MRFLTSRARPTDTPWRAARWTAIDLELTGLDPAHDQIIAVGIVPIEDGRVLLGEAQYTLVRSSRASSAGALLTHKLRTADVADGASVQETRELLATALASSTPVFHAAAVERAFLEPLLRRGGVRLARAADTDRLGRRWLTLRDGTEPPRLSLEGLAERLGQRAEPPHHALADALTTAQAFIAIASLLDARAPQTVRTLLDASEPPPRVRRLG